MMADDDGFDIDIYGDEAPEYVQESAADVATQVQGSNGDNPITSTDKAVQETTAGEPETEPPNEDIDEIDYDTTEDPQIETQEDIKTQQQDQALASQQQISSTTAASGSLDSAPRQAPQQQGIKREEDGQDTRDVDPGATTALRLAELQWWITEDDIRGWANQAQVEDEVKDITFHEHKVNGKSKG